MSFLKALIDTFLKKTEVVPPVVIPEVKPEPVIIPEPVVIQPVKSDKMTISAKGLLELADREGLAQTPYLDSVGVKTVGIGVTKSDIPDLASWPWDRTMSVKDAVSSFKQHVQPYADAVSKALKVPVTQYQFDALVSICYNIGITGMKNSTFMKRINAKASMSEIVGAILMWDKPKEIIGRRKKEANLFSKGVYNNTDGCVDLISVSPTTHKPSYKGRVRIAGYL